MLQLLDILSSRGPWVFNIFTLSSNVSTTMFAIIPYVYYTNVLPTYRIVINWQPQ